LYLIQTATIWPKPNRCCPAASPVERVGSQSLLALTLLMPSWLLPPPRECRQTASAVHRLTAGAVPSKDRRLLLCAAELSVRAEVGMKRDMVTSGRMTEMAREQR